jgi:hypothetical protein
MIPSTPTILQKRASTTVIQGGKIATGTIQANTIRTISIDIGGANHRFDTVREKLVEMGADEDCLKLHDLAILMLDLDGVERDINQARAWSSNTLQAQMTNLGSTMLGNAGAGLAALRDRRAEIVQKVAKLRCDLFGDDDGVLWLLKNS